MTESEAVKALATLLSTFRSLSRNPKPRYDENVSKSLGAFLDEQMSVIVRNRAKNRGGDKKPDFVLCTSHDLAPLLQTALGLERGFDEAKEFKSAYKKWDRAQCRLRRRRSSVGDHR